MSSEGTRYFNDTYVYEHIGGKAKVVSSVSPPPPPYKGTSGVAVALDETIFHPQGGGQAADHGTITHAGDTNVVFHVADVRADRETGIVWHYGDYAEACTGRLEDGAAVDLRIDAARRQHNARLHSAGHLLDVAVAKTIPEAGLIPGRGCHFPTECWVEYEGKLEGDLEAIKTRLQTACDELVAAEGAVVAEEVPYEEAKKRCGGELPPYIPDDGSNVRVVTIGGHAGCPCGGTHIDNTNRLTSALTITKLASKKKKTKVTYEVAPLANADAVPQEA